MELEVAYSLMKSSGSEHTVDSYYKQLKTEVGVLDKNSEEFAVIQEYVQNTHAETHRSYELVVEDVYTIKRQGEDKRFKPFKKLHNHKLLWHGSRVTNFAGILSQGLRIAPPEAPVTGYMFGKGIYFADMVSKSANYCNTHALDPKGLLLLCDVALGNVSKLCRDSLYRFFIIIIYRNMKGWVLISSRSYHQENTVAKVLVKLIPIRVLANAGMI